MATYAIGDIQGCYDALRSLLDEINFHKERDQLWFTGDLVNRGPQSLEVLRFIKQLPNAIVVLGNHDFHLLTLTLSNTPPTETLEHTMEQILSAPDRNTLLDWLRHQKLLHYDANFAAAISHAGIYPDWSIAQALQYANEVEAVIRSDNIANFLDHLFGDQPDQWDESLSGDDRLRFIVNVFTRMRYLSPTGRLILEVKGPIGQQPPDHIPWFNAPSKIMPDINLLFGHWAALEGVTHHPHAIALDTGYVWGGALTAYRLDDQRFFRVTNA